MRGFACKKKMTVRDNRALMHTGDAMIACTH